MRFSILIVIGFLFSSCSQHLINVNDPVTFAHVTQKSDFNFTCGINYSESTKGINLQSSMAVSNKLFLTGSYTDYSSSVSKLGYKPGWFGREFWRCSGRSLMGGIGYYRKVGQNTFFEGLFGSSYGNIINFTERGNYEYQYRKYFIQPGISFSGKFFQYGSALRVNFVDYLPHSTGPNKEIPVVAGLELVSLDPAVYLGLGSKILQIGIQVSASLFNSAFYNSNFQNEALTMDMLSFTVFTKFSIPDKKELTNRKR